METEIEWSVDGGLLEIHLARPAKKNAVTPAMYREMIVALGEASRQEDVAAVLIAGQGDAFCAGNDMANFLEDGDPTVDAFAFIDAIAAFDKPIVAAVHGLAIGVGATMLLHCDLIYAAPGTRFSMPFIDLGVVPEAGATLLVPHIVGNGKAAAMLLMGESIDAETAEKAGLVTEIVDPTALLSHARAKANALARKPRAALLETRRLLKENNGSLTDRIAREKDLFRAFLTTEEARDRISRFVGGPRR
jgi:enoyl-CoA hydratase/carnithine racemase